jgi:hypothetical protein
MLKGALHIHSNYSDGEFTSPNSARFSSLRVLLLVHDGSSRVFRRGVHTALHRGIETWNSKYDGRYAPRSGTFALLQRLRQRAPAGVDPKVCPPEAPVRSKLPVGLVASANHRFESCRNETLAKLAR